MTTYLAIVHKDHNSDFGVSFPDFPGCVTAGSTLDEAKDMAHDALSLHVKGMLEDRETLPAPSKLEDIIDNPDYSDAAAILVISISEEKSRTVRINITLPENILRKIDVAAKQRGMSRSSFLVHAAENVLAAPNKNNSSSQPA
jgi:predicted RNase H-like HicB family nuclease